jgi:hypothetical protein
MHTYIHTCIHTCMHAYMHTETTQRPYTQVTSHLSISLVGTEHTPARMTLCFQYNDLFPFRDEAACRSLCFFEGAWCEGASVCLRHRDTHQMAAAASERIWDLPVESKGETKAWEKRLSHQPRDSTAHYNAVSPRRKSSLGCAHHHRVARARQPGELGCEEDWQKSAAAGDHANSGT